MKNINFNDIWTDKSFRWSIVLSSVFLSVGFSFLHFGLAIYGWAIFILLPIVIGVSIGALPNKKVAIYGFAFMFFLFLMLLLLGGLEGFVCVIMCMPIIIPFFFLGAIISHLKSRYKKIKQEINFKMTLLPFLIFMLAVPLERAATSDLDTIVEVRSEILLPYTPLQVFDAIKSVDTLIAEKPFLMKLDLPIPQKCILEKEEVGALRICYFEGGRIIERVTEYNPGVSLKMDVIDYELTGRNWLGFKEAIYLFEAVGSDSCKMKRITTYSSELYPRIYWEPLERMGVEQEHQYVFNNLERDLSNSFSLLK